MTFALEIMTSLSVLSTICLILEIYDRKKSIKLLCFILLWIRKIDETYILEVSDMLWKDLQYILEDKHSLVCDWLLGIQHCSHIVHWDKGRHSADFDMLSMTGIHCSLYIQDGKQHRDLQSSLGCIDKILLVLFACRQHCFHMVKDCMDQLFQLLEVLKIVTIKY